MTRQWKSDHISPNPILKYGPGVRFLRLSGCPSLGRIEAATAIPSLQFQSIEHLLFLIIFSFSSPLLTKEFSVYESVLGVMRLAVRAPEHEMRDKVNQQGKCRCA